MSKIVESRWNNEAWVSVGAPGIHRRILRDNGNGGATYLLKFAAGVAAPSHNHPEGEELFVVQGDITVGGRRLTTGDYLYTPANQSHDAVAHAETVLLLSLPKLPVFQ